MTCKALGNRLNSAPYFQYPGVFAFVSGHGVNGLASQYGGVPALQKSFRSEDLERLLRQLMPRGG